MEYIPERSSTHVYRVNKISKEEMDSMVNLCVYEQPPFCNAACPLKLDVKSMLNAAAAGDFKKALSIYEKAAVFPLVIAAGCDAPCQQKCRLCEVGDAVAIRDVEIAIARFGEHKRSGGVFRSKKRKKTAIFGSGLFCLLLAGELEKKAYPITVFCPESDMEAYLRSAADFLCEADFTLEYARLKEKDIDFVFNCQINTAFFEEKRSEFDVVCATEAAAKSIFPDAFCEEGLMIYRSENLVMGTEGNVLDTAAAAKRAALTVDRLAQKLDPANSRGTEGAVVSRLYTDLGMAKSLQSVEKPADGYSKEQAMQEAQRCIQCYCDECFKGCAYLQHYKKHPALLSREIYNNTQIIMGDHQLNKPMNSCSLCGQCTVTCPNGFDMAKVCHSARQNMVSTDKMPLAPHEFALMDMMFSNGDAFLCLPQPGYEKCKYVFFPGCQASAIAPETVRAAYEDLCDRLEGGVALMLGCCGAICDWAGRYDMYDKTKQFIDTELAKLGDPIIIAGCPTCKKTLSAHENAQVTGIWTILNEIGLPETERESAGTAALHDSCGARGDAETQNAIRTLVEKLGFTIVETDYSGDRSPCCGYGGLTSYTNREVAQEMTEKCLSRSEESYISYCMACRDRFAREGRESKHILELIYGTDAGSPPDISQRRYNRLQLKEALLQQLWGQEVLKPEMKVNVEFTEEALTRMDDRMILKSDVIAVLEHVHDSGEAIFDSEAELFIARKRLGNVTFWVKYRDMDTHFLVESAYSHRMNIIQRQG